MPEAGTRHLILGGVRSGKSRMAERLAAESALPVTFVATASAGDSEMRSRIDRHRRRRPRHWQVVEEPLQLGSVVAGQSGAGRCVVVDCLTLWLTNLLCRGDEPLLSQERDALLEAVAAFRGCLILVSNETGLGIIPTGALSRRYCDEAGRLHRRLAALCERVTLTVAGLPLNLKPGPEAGRQR